MRHFFNLIFVWDLGIIFGLNYFSRKIHVAVCGIKTPLKRKEMHKVNSSTKIDLYIVHHHQILLKGKVLQKTSPYFHYDHSRFLCMRIDLVCAPIF